MESHCHNLGLNLEGLYLQESGFGEEFSGADAFLVGRHDVVWIVKEDTL